MVRNITNEVSRLNQSMYIRTMDLEYEGSKDRWLDCKKNILGKIPQEILGFGYTVSYDIRCKCESFDDVQVQYHERISEYVFYKHKYLNSLGKLKYDIEYAEFFGMFSRSNIRNVVEEQSEKYKSEIKEMGYIELPEGFMSLHDDEIIELFETNKVNVKKK